MDFKEIQELIRMVNKHNIAELTVENQDFKVKIKTALASFNTQAPVVIPQVQQTPVLQPVQQAATSEKTTSAEESRSENNKSAGGHTIKSPIVGTFYRSAGPDKEPFVKVGDEINIGDKLCIIEAMKLFNEIESEVAGKIIKILADDASPVEYDQPLFLVELK